MLSDFLSEQVDETVAVRVILDDLLARVAAPSHVVNGTAKFPTQRTRHASSLATKSYKVKA